MQDWKQHITIYPNQCGGRPYIRNMSISVVDILDLLSEGFNQEQLLEEVPHLEVDDIEEAVRYARGKIDHPMVEL